MCRPPATSTDDIELLERLDIQASVHPTHITHADMIRLMTLAGFGSGTALWKQVLDADDPMLADAHTVRLLLRWAKDPGKRRSIPRASR
jgi:hypothetical protein